LCTSFKSGWCLARFMLRRARSCRCLYCVFRAPLQLDSTKPANHQNIPRKNISLDIILSFIACVHSFYRSGLFLFCCTGLNELSFTNTQINHRLARRLFISAESMKAFPFVYALRLIWFIPCMGALGTA
jgi:hypothetical protein